jgi:hypothetical protein
MRKFQSGRDNGRCTDQSMMPESAQRILLARTFGSDDIMLQLV